MIGELRTLLNRYLPSYNVRSVAKLGGGVDNAAYEVNGELIVRARKETDPNRRSESTRREADLLAALKELSPLPVPEPIFADVKTGVLAYFKLPGIALLDRPVAEPTRLAPDLGEFLGRLHQAPVQEMEKLVGRDNDTLTAWRREAERDFLKVAEQLPAKARRLVEDFLGRTPLSEGRVVAFCHNDLGAEHLLVEVGTNSITGVIDWTDAAIADPAYDLALIYRDLGPEVFDLTLDYYGRAFDAADRERTVFYARCSLLEDVAYGLSTAGARRYAWSGLARLARTFA